MGDVDEQREEGSGEQEPTGWLRAQVEADKAAALAASANGAPSMTWTPRMHPSDHVMVCDGNGEAVAYDEGVPTEEQAAHMVIHDPRDTVADCDAKMAIIDRCAALALPEGEAYTDWWAERDNEEVVLAEALADLADDILALLADGYRHRPGWADHWACPGCGKPLHEVPDGHAMGISMQDGTWSCSDPSPVAPVPSFHIASPPAPGVRFEVFVPPGSESLGVMPPPIGHGFTIDIPSVRAPVTVEKWRSLVRSAEGNPEAGWTVEFEIEGRYAEARLGWRHDSGTAGTSRAV